MTQFPQTFQIHYFAAASSYTQRETESLPAPTPLSRLFPILEEKYPGIREKVLSSCSVALGGEYVDLDLDSGEGEGKDTVIAPGDEVAIIPPVSSG
jgi:molybdopterin converting factor small subunit